MGHYPFHAQSIPGGCVRQTDRQGFFDEDQSKKNAQIEWWVKWMVNNGLSDDIAKRFISCNQEMTSMPSYAQISAAVSNQFDTEYFAVHDKRSPFGILLLRKKGRVGGSFA